MARPLLTLVSVSLSALVVGAFPAYAQSSSGSGCGTETWSTDKMAYVNVPCAAGQETASAPAQAGAKAPAAPGCGIETWSTDKMAYVTSPCAAGLTEENPGASKK
jgi:hypothetical protein